MPVLLYFPRTPIGVARRARGVVTLPSHSVMSFLQVAGYATFAAMAAALGPLVGRARRADDHNVGMATAVAAGMMLGLAYPLMRDALDTGAVWATVGAGVAVVALFLVHVAFEIDGATLVAPRRALGAAAVHAAPEGLALGVACAVDSRFGLVVALTLALHNVGEGMALGVHLARHGGAGRAPLVAAFSNLPQVALGLAGFMLASAVPALRPALLGASAGSLVYLSLADLLPDAYRAAGRTAISVAVIAATSMVAFAGALG